MPRSRTRSWATTTAMWLLFVVGCGIGVLLSGLPDLRIYKLLNLIGVIWSIFGLVTLSYLTATTEKFQLAALRYSFFFFAILVIELPIGLMAGSVVGIFQKLPSARTVIVAGSYLAVPGMLSFFVFDHFVDSRPRWNFTTKTRVGVLGGYFVLGGLLAQLVGATFDLFDFNG